jgi:sigma-B regulation protein RsbU (phosphoserine phosphatase)
MQLIAQQTPSRPGTGLGGLQRPHRPPPSAPVNAQPTAEAIFDASNLGSPLKLDKDWRVGMTANPAASASAFDDSTWPVQDAQRAFAEISNQDHPATPPVLNSNIRTPGSTSRAFTWYRLHMKLAPNHGPLSLLVELPVARKPTFDIINSDVPGVEVFANGKLIHPEGVNSGNPENYHEISRIYDLDFASSETSLTLAVRSVNFPVRADFFATHNLLLGNREDLEQFRELRTVHGLFEHLPRQVNSLIQIGLAIFLLTLFFTQKGHIEYLWLSLHELLLAPIGYVYLAHSSAWLDHRWYWALSLQLLTVSAYLYFEFLVAFLSLHRRRYIQLLRYCAPILAALGPTLLLAGHSTAVTAFQVIVCSACGLWLLGALVFIFITLIKATARRNFEAGLLLIPLLLAPVGWIEPLLAAGTNNWIGRGNHSPLTIDAGPVPIHFAAIADFTGLLAIMLIIFFRFLRVQHDQERVASELAAARSVQELMIPQEKLVTPGFEVHAIYTPAYEVGGDFYHVQSTAEGGLRVVIGDVTGKGLKAAMNASMLMGALRHTLERSPAKILESLNRVLIGNESFTTCQAAWFGANGELVVANAGHPPPYLNGQEVAVAGALPLGVLPEAHYEEIRLNLRIGDHLLMLSDGVAEARSPAGELFGFDRVHNLSKESAFFIAEAAKSFGQRDDITVLTVRRLARP